MPPAASAAASAAAPCPQFGGAGRGRVVTSSRAMSVSRAAGPDRPDPACRRPAPRAPWRRRVRHYPPIVRSEWSEAETPCAGRHRSPAARISGAIGAFGMFQPAAHLDRTALADPARRHRPDRRRPSRRRPEAGRSGLKRLNSDMVHLGWKPGPRQSCPAPGVHSVICARPGPAE